MTRNLRRFVLFTGSVLLLTAYGLWSAHHRREALSRALIAALLQNNPVRAQRLVEAGADPNARLTPLPAPSLRQWCRYLLHRAKPPVNDSPTAILLACGWSPSDASDLSEHWHMCLDSPRLVASMLEHGADPHVKDMDNCTLLHRAVEQNLPETARLLVDHGADINARSYSGCTPLLTASYKNLSLIRFLLDRGAEVNASDNANQTPLLQALAQYNAAPYDERLSTDITRLLMDHGANVNARNAAGMTPLLLTFEHRYPVQVARLLLDRHADVKTKNALGETALTLAVADRETPPDLLLQLLAHGADTEARDQYGSTPLLLACRNQSAPAIRILIAHGADARAQEPYHETTLYLLVLCSAAKQDRTAAEMIPLLLAHGADPSVRAYRRFTVLQLARLAKRSDLIAVLQRGRANAGSKRH